MQRKAVWTQNMHQRMHKFDSVDLQSCPKGCEASFATQSEKSEMNAKCSMIRTIPSIIFNLGNAGTFRHTVVVALLIATHWL
mmetsp:Transcript_19622/g.31150  ORF Transcript_19622/g.31150 Transcript_19622/m.31150 type:complete len:82 (+) Transcript_19622:58-303(+)